MFTQTPTPFPVFWLIFSSPNVAGANPKPCDSANCPVARPKIIPCGDELQGCRRMMEQQDWLLLSWGVTVNPCHPARTCFLPAKAGHHLWCTLDVDTG